MYTLLSVISVDTATENRCVLGTLKLASLSLTPTLQQTYEWHINTVMVREQIEQTGRLDLLWVEWAGRIPACQDQIPGVLCKSLAPIKGKKSKWVPFSEPCQGMPLREHTMYNRVSTRSLLGGRECERVKGYLRVET